MSGGDIPRSHQPDFLFKLFSRKSSVSRNGYELHIMFIWKIHLFGSVLKLHEVFNRDHKLRGSIHLYSV